MLKSDSIGALGAALAKAQGEIKAAAREANNPFFGKPYSDLSAVWDACREQLSKNGLAVVQTTDNTENKIIVETTLIHASGEWISGKLFLAPTKNDPQGVGSAITYGRRYSLAAIVGVAPEGEDDDGNAASGFGGKEEKRAPAKRQEKAAEPPKEATKSCPCGETLAEKTIQYYNEHPNLERLCFACGTRKKKKEPYGKDRPKKDEPKEIDFISSMADMRAKLGDNDFFLILGRHGVEAPEEITDKGVQAQVSQEMMEKLKEGGA